MVVDNTPQAFIDMKMRLHEIVASDRISSIDMISDIIGVGEDAVRDSLQSLVEDGSIQGSFSSDGTRFYLSDVKISEAPVILSDNSVPEIKPPDTRQAKMVAIVGFLMLLLGTIIRGFSSIDIRFNNVGTVVFLLGLPVLIVGWILYSRSNPPSIIR